MVFEHVEDIETALDEIHRVLKPGGKFILAFPTKECLKEGHILMPFIPWFQGKTRWYAIYILRLIGFGKDEFPPHTPGESPIRGLSPIEWADFAHDLLTKYVIYRTRRSVLQSLRRHFTVSPIEHEYVHFRLNGNPILLIWPIRTFTKIAFRLLRCDIMECRPKHDSSMS